MVVGGGDDKTEKKKGPHPTTPHSKLLQFTAREVVKFVPPVYPTATLLYTHEGGIQKRSRRQLRTPDPPVQLLLGEFLTAELAGGGGRVGLRLVRTRNLQLNPRFFTQSSQN